MRISSSFANTPVLSLVNFGLVSLRKSSICKTRTEFSPGVSTKDGFFPFFTSTIFLSFSNFITSTLLIFLILFISLLCVLCEQLCVLCGKKSNRRVRKDSQKFSAFFAVKQAKQLTAEVAKKSHKVSQRMKNRKVSLSLYSICYSFYSLLQQCHIEIYQQAKFIVSQLEIS